MSMREDVDIARCEPVNEDTGMLSPVSEAIKQRDSRDEIGRASSVKTQRHPHRVNLSIRTDI